ncbi:MAG TPA: MTAP family purine nucleoside phosphorylase [Mycobacteriales bacterium]|jgi:5'-methylthioadenosine phosphorylase|nr:MTAP family purine nucleoside phosphorylase [Mycobacteriales bacterium]
MADSTNWVTASDAPIGVIAGSGLYELFGADAPSRSIATPYGDTSAPITLGRLGDRDVAFLPRHGTGHSVPPHRINYRANIWALRSLGVRGLVTFSAVGGLNRDCGPGQFVLTDQIIDRTHGRPDTFFDGDVLAASGVQHLSAAVPFCPRLREAASASLAELGERFHPTGTVVVIQGPRFSTAAESRWFRDIGGDTVNMTQYPETVLAGELGIGVVNLSYVTDSDAGLADAESGSGEDAVQHHDVLARLTEAQPRIRAALAAIVRAVPSGYRPNPGIAEPDIAAVLDQPVVAR